MHYDVIVVGGSFAGLASALYLARARRTVRVIDSGLPRNRFAAHSHGFLTQDGRAPADILTDARAQVAAYPTVQFISGNASSAESTATGFAVTLASGERMTSDRLVLAFGVTDELPALPGLAARWGHTVLHCPYCHGYEVRGQALGVLASSPMSVHQAQLVAEWGPTTFFLNGIEPLDAEVLTSLALPGVTIEDVPVAALEGEGTSLSHVCLDDGRIVPLDALFIGAPTRLNSPIAEQLGCAIGDGMSGPMITVDAFQQTTVPGVFAAGDIARAGHSVSWAVADGVMAGVAAHRSLVFPTPVTPPAGHVEAPIEGSSASESAEQFWNDRYRQYGRLWSGTANEVMRSIAENLHPGRSLDLGCSNGGDAIWLAQRGWNSVGVDIAPTAIELARASAREAGVSGPIHFECHDLSMSMPDGPFDLITASFFHSPIDMDRPDVFRRAADRLRVNGLLLIVDHGSIAPWSYNQDPDQVFPEPSEIYAGLELDPARWTAEWLTHRERDAIGPDGLHATVRDTIVMVRRVS
jgi:thioredoxin reductase/SAM-dependent methyltransferase